MTVNHDPARDAAYLQAARAALAQFPVTARDLHLVSVSENVTFRVLAASGDYALRLHRPGYNSRRELESERAWVRALGEAGLHTQRGVASRSGEEFVTQAVPGSDERRLVGLTTWVPGSPLAEALDACPGLTERADIFFRIGALAATSHNQASGWEPPPGFTRPALDVDGLLGRSPRWGRFWEHVALTTAQAQRLRSIRDRLRKALLDYGRSAANYSLIHADLHAENILCHDGELALIDFDDCAFGWHMHDLASALIEDCIEDGAPATREALLRGYRSRRALSRRDESMLDTFLLLRGLALIGWHHQRPEHAGSAFFDAVCHFVFERCRELEAA